VAESSRLLKDAMGKVETVCALTNGNGK